MSHTGRQKKESEKEAMVAEIRRLYKDVKDLEECKRAYEKAKQDSHTLLGELEELKRSQAAFDLEPLRREIKGLEREYAEIFQQMENTDSRSRQQVFSPKDILSFLSSLVDHTLKKKQALRLASSLIQKVSVSDIQATSANSGVDTACCTVSIDKELESAAKSFEEEKFYRDFLSCTRNRLEELVGSAAVPEDVRVFVNSGRMLLVLLGDTSQEDDLPSFTDPGPCEKHSLVSLTALYPVVGRIVCSLLRSNLARTLVDREFDVASIVRNNACFEGTEYFSTNIEDWILDVVIKRIIYESKSARTADNTVFQNGRLVSRQYASIEKSLTMYKRTNSVRKEKASGIIRATLLDFFDVLGILDADEDSNNKKKSCKSMMMIKEKMYSREYPERLSYDEMQLLFICFSDVSMFISRHQECVFINELQRVREKLSSYCVQFSGMIDESLLKRLQGTLIEAKAALQEVHYDFFENLDNFVDDTETKQRLSLGFFEVFYKNFASVCIPLFRDPETVADISRYLLDLSHGYDRGAIPSYAELEKLVQYPRRR